MNTTHPAIRWLTICLGAAICLTLLPATTGCDDDVGYSSASVGDSSPEDDRADDQNANTEGNADPTNGTDVNNLDGRCVLEMDEIISEGPRCDDAPQLHLDATGTPHVGWVTQTPYLGHYAVRADDGWRVAPVAEGMEVRFMSLAVSAEGQPVALVTDIDTQTSLWSGDPLQLKQEYAGARFVGSRHLVFDGDVLHGAMATYASPGAETIRTAEYGVGDANRLDVSTLVRREGTDLRIHELAVAGREPYILHSNGLEPSVSFDGQETRIPTEPNTYLSQLAAWAPPQGATQLYAAGTGYDMETQETNLLFFSNVDDAWTSTEFVRDLAYPDASMCPVQGEEGDLCPIEHVRHGSDFEIVAYPGGALVFLNRIHTTGNLRFTCQDFLGELPCGWVSETLESHSLDVALIDADGTLLELERLDGLDGAATMSAKIDAEGNVHLAAAQNIAEDMCTLRYLRLACD